MLLGEVSYSGCVWL